jgi:peptidoglycan-associated lipoprotein
LRIEPPSIRLGQSALLTWESRNASSVTIEPAIGSVDLSGRVKFFPDETTAYTVRATGPGGSVSKSVTVDVISDLSGAGTIDEQDIRNLPVDEQFKSQVRPVFFGFDSADLSEQAILTLESNSTWLLRPENVGLRFVLEGHADERGSEEYNLALGDKRAQAVFEYLVEKGVADSRMTTVSLGEERPFDRSATEEAYSLNRRVEFILLQTSP